MSALTIAGGWNARPAEKARTSLRICRVRRAIRRIGVLLLFPASMLPAVLGGQSVPPAAQNPSPMVEHTRAHERLSPSLEHDIGGARRTFAGPLGKPVEVWIPNGIGQRDDVDPINAVEDVEIVLPSGARRKFHVGPQFEDAEIADGRRTDLFPGPDHLRLMIYDLRLASIQTLAQSANHPSQIRNFWAPPNLASSRPANAQEPLRRCGLFVRPVASPACPVARPFRWISRRDNRARSTIWRVRKFPRQKFRRN